MHRNEQATKPPRRRLRSGDESSSASVLTGSQATSPPAATSSSGAKSPVAARATSKKYTDAERIEKHRAVVRRGYYQKKAIKTQLRQELGELEQQYRAVMAHTSPPTTPPDWAPHCAGCAHVESLRQRFKEQVLETEALRRENDALEKRLWKHTDFLDKLQWYLSRQAEEERVGGLPPLPELPESDIKKEEPPAASLTTTRKDRQTIAPVSFAPLTPSECAAIAQIAQREICSQTRCPGFRDAGPPVMGWNRMHKFGETSKFSLLKCFYGRRASTLAARAWELYATTELLGQLYSRGKNVRFDVLQRVDEENVLLRRTMQTEELVGPKTTFFLMARREARTDDGRMQQQILFRSVDSERIPTGALERDGWLEMYYWICFDDCDGTEDFDSLDDSNRDNNGPYCQVEFGGHVPCISVADTAFWTMEFLSYILRLENHAVDSVFNINL